MKKLCMGCMNYIDDSNQTCPICGFNENTNQQEAYFLKPGSIVGGRYILGRSIKYGGHTVSYIGWDAMEEKKVIVKEYLPSDFSTRAEGENDIIIYSGDAQKQFEIGLESFMNEANKIQHLPDVETIAKVYDCLVENDTGYLITEYVEGVSLKDYLAEKEKDGTKYRFTVKAAVKMIAKILKDLAKVHPLNVVHCDISPESIIITKDGENLGVKLVDFGNTRYVTTANSKSLAIILKQGYAPEEQYRSKGVRGPWTDVYALAAVMYRMITGIVPQESVERALTDELKDPSKLGVKIPPYMENALMNALMVYPEERTRSAEVFLAELKDKSTKRRKGKKNKNRNVRFPIWAKGMVAALLLVSLGGGVLLYNRTHTEEETIKSEQILMPDLVGLFEKDAQNEIEKLNKDNGWDISLVSDGTFIYNPNAKTGKDTGDSIYWASVPANIDMKDESQVEEYGLKFEDGKISGEIKYNVSTSEKLHYSDLANKNVKQIAKYLNKSTDESLFDKVKNSEKSYWDLESIELANNKSITSKSLNKKKNQKKELLVKDIKKINYYYAPFLYFEELPDFVQDYGTISKLNEKKFETYVKNSDDANEKTGKKKKFPKTLINDDYYYISFYDVGMEGKIVNQSVKAGKEFDQSKMDVPVLIDVIGKAIHVQDLTGNDAKQKILDEFDWINPEDIVFYGTEDGTNEVIECNVDIPSGKEYFEKNEKISIQLTLYVPPEPDPVPIYTPPSQTPDENSIGLGNIGKPQ